MRIQMTSMMMPRPQARAWVASASLGLTPLTGSLVRSYSLRNP